MQEGQAAQEEYINVAQAMSSAVPRTVMILGKSKLSWS